MLLEQKLSEIGIPFWTETDMRAHGFFKTPDIWLQVGGNPTLPPSV